MSEFGDEDLVERSIRETETLRQSVFVGVGRDLTEALDNAWEAAKRFGAEPGTRFRIYEQSGVGYNPFTDFKVVIGPHGH